MAYLAHDSKSTNTTTTPIVVSLTNISAAGLSVGDLLVLTAGHNAPSSVVDNLASNPWTQVQADNSGIAKGFIWYKIAEGGETSVSVEISGGDTGNAHVLAFRSSLGAITLEDSDIDITNISTVVGSQDTGSATATNADGLALYCIFPSEARKWFTPDDSVASTAGTIIATPTISNANKSSTVAYLEYTGAAGAKTATFTSSQTSANLGMVVTFAYGAGGGGVAVNFSGTIGNQNASVGSAFSLDASTYFSGTETPFSYAQTAGTSLASVGLTLGGGTGIISGTPTSSGTLTGVVITATDANTDTAASNAFSITVDAITGTITIGSAAPHEGYMYPIKVSSGQATVTRPITYTGTPSGLQYALLKKSDLSVVQAMTTFDASPSGGTSTLTFEPPRTTDSLIIKVQFVGGASISDQETIGWKSGCVIAIAGQSFARRFADDTAITADAGQTQWNGSAVVAPTVGAGTQEMASILRQAISCPIQYYNGAVDDSPLTLTAATNGGSGTNYWSNSNSSLFTGLMSGVSGMTAGTNKVSLVIWAQGEEDMTNGAGGQEYLGINQPGGLNSVFTNIRGQLKDPEGDPVPIVHFIGSHNTDDTSIQPIAEAKRALTRFDPLMYEVNGHHFDVDATWHPVEASYRYYGKLFAATYINHLGLVSASSPKCIKATFSVDKTQLTLEWDQELAATPTSYEASRIRVSVDGSLKTPATYARAGDYETIMTFAAAIDTNANEIKVMAPYGKGLADGYVHPTSVAVTLPGSGGSVLIPCGTVANVLYKSFV